MGGYLAKPVTSTKKTQGQGLDGSLQYGSACMQGWRPKMEDSHAVRFDLDQKGRARRIEGVFGVFDGHGGKEVALYCSNHLVNALTSISMYKRDEDIGECLRETFMRIDCSILTKQGQSELKRLRAEDDHVICIHKDLFPLLKRKKEAAQKQPQVAEQDDEDSLDGYSDSDSDDDVEEGEEEEEEEKTQEDPQYDSDGETEVTADSETIPISPELTKPEEDDQDAVVVEEKRQRRDEQVRMQRKRKLESRPERESHKRSKPSFLDVSHPIWARILEVGEKKGLTQVSKSAPLRKPSNVERPKSSGTGLEILPRRKALQHLENPDMICISKDEVSPKHPGVDSGCTALVAAIESTDDESVKRLVVVNAGDSRCVLSRNGRALEMSQDHGLHLKEEQDRIARAGGVITEDGRINGKLNLSRAIGDHQFKQQRNRPLKDQMVTSYADVQSTMIHRGQDEFMVLACDGIWDAMTSQQVIDFVRERILKGLPLPEIGAEMCKACLARDVDKDPGTDNMSVLICKLF